MSISNIYGPKELFVCPRDTLAANAIAEKDEASSITWLENSQKQEKKEYLNGQDKILNILMLAASKSNVSLVRYIVEHIEDERILDMKDSYGRTALFYAAIGTGPIEKVQECVKILLAKGADPHVRPCKKITPSRFDVEPQLDYYGSNLAGILLDGALNAEKKAIGWNQNTCAKVLELILAHKATCYSDRFGEIKVNTTSLSCEEFPEFQELSSEVKARVRIVQTAYDNIFWSKLRFLSLATRSPTSPIAQLPEDINSVLIQRLTESQPEQ